VVRISAATKPRPSDPAATFRLIGLSIEHEFYLP
jgi:hypothetical protein